MTVSVLESFLETYSHADVEKVVRRFTADLKMIANSTRLRSEQWAADVGYDVEILSNKGFLERVDVMLFSGATEVKAAKYVVNTAAGELTSSRPGGVMWPQVTNASLEVILTYNDKYTPAERIALKPKLRRPWSPSSQDTSHSTLASSAGRDYASKTFGLQRTDYS